jgi:Aminopeptidase P, N-terminal domain
VEPVNLAAHPRRSLPSASVSDRGDAKEVAQQLGRRRAAAAAAWNLSDEIVLVGAGDPVPVPGRRDLTYPFRARSEYYYLTDSNRPGGVLAFDPGQGWVDFVVHPTAEDRLWFVAF